jgi:hypothetical protein
MQAAAARAVAAFSRDWALEACRLVDVVPLAGG